MQDATKTNDFQFEGEYRHSPLKRFNEVVVFVHHFGGHKRSTKRHQEIILEAGYDCVIFNLYGHSFLSPLKMLFHLLTFHKDFVLTWTEELDQILNQIPGQKIVYTLSSPSTSVVGCLGLKKRKDILAWICDCGPFLDAWHCFRNYGLYEAQIKNPVLLGVFTALGYLMFGGLHYQKRMKNWLPQIPRSLPILSLRAADDLLVPPSSIDKFFNIYKDLNLQTHCFSQSGHLSAIKTQASEYKQILVTFLQNIQKREPSS